MNQIDARLKKLHEYTTTAYRHMESNHYEDALTNLRKGCEAICRIYILKKSGEEAGMKHIKAYSTLHELTKFLKKEIGAKLYHRFEDIRYGGNASSHDPKKSTDKTLGDADLILCNGQYHKIIKWLYTDILKTEIPQELLDIMDQQKTTGALCQEKPWEDFKSSCHDFSSQYDYILIAPPEINGCSPAQLASLAGGGWGLVFDFNPDSKTSGLLCAAEQNMLSRENRPITIKQRHDLVISNNRFITNWYLPTACGRSNRR